MRSRFEEFIVDRVLNKCSRAFSARSSTPFAKGVAALLRWPEASHRRPPFVIFAVCGLVGINGRV